MRRKVLITLFVLLGLPVVLVATGWYLLGNEAFLKQQLHNLVLRQTGRSLDVVGSLRITPGATTRIEAEDMRLSNASWAAEPYMTRVGRLELALDVWSFFSDSPVVNSLEATNCQVALAEDAAGARNWDLWPGALTADDDTSAQHRHFQLSRLQLSNCHVTHAAPDRHEPLVVEIAWLSLQQTEDGNYTGQASGKMAELPLSLTGHFGPAQSIWLGGPFDHDLGLSVGKISLQSSGSFADIQTGRGANILLKFSGPEFAEVTEYLALPPFSSDAFDFSLKLITQGAMTSLDVDGDLGSFEISASGELDRIIKPTTGQLNMTTKGPDLEALGQLFGLEGLVHTAFELSLVATVENGRAKLAPAVLTTAQDRVEVSGVLGLSTDLKDSSLKVTAHSDEFGRWASLLGHPVSPLGPLAAEGQLDTDSAGEVSVQAEVQYRASRLKINGTLGQLPLPNLPSVDFDLETPDVSQLAAITLLKGLPVAKVQAKGHVSRENEGIQFKSVVGSLAKNQFEFSGFLSSKDQLKGSKFNVQANIPSTSALGVLFGHADLPDQPLKLTATLTPVGKGMDFQLTDASLGAIQLSLNGHMADAHTPSLFTADGKIELPSAKLLQFLSPKMKLPDLPLSFRGGIGHESGTLQFRQAHLILGQNSMDADGQLSLNDTLERSSLKISGSGPDLSQVLDTKLLDSLPHNFSFAGQWSNTGQVNGMENFHVQLGDMELLLDGTADSILEPRNLVLQVKLSVPDASVLNTMLQQNLEAVPLSAEALYTGSFHEFSLSKLSIKLGENQVQGDLQVSLGDDGKVSGTLQSTFLDLKPWLDESLERKVEPVGTPATTKAPEGIRMFPDELVLEVGKTALDMDLDVEVDRIDLGNAEVKDVHLGILLTDHQLHLNPFELSDEKGSSVVGQFVLDATVGVPTMSLKLNGANLRIGLAAAAGQDLSTYPPAEVFASLQGSGYTWHELASSVNGKVRFYQGSGLIATAAFDSFYSDFISRLFRGLGLSGKTSAYTRFDCGVFAANVVAGQVKVDTIVFQTEHVTVFSAGTIDLETEKIDFTFHTKTRTGLGISAGAAINPFTKVGGTLKSPAMEFNAGGAVLGGGAAVATVGLSYLAKSFSDRFLSSRDPCGDARKKLEKGDGEGK